MKSTILISENKVLIIGYGHDIRTLTKNMVEELLTKGEAVIISQEQFQLIRPDFNALAEAIRKLGETTTEATKSLEFINEASKKFYKKIPEYEGSRFINKPKHNYKRR